MTIFGLAFAMNAMHFSREPERVCPSVGPLVRWSVGPSVRRSVGPSVRR